MARHFSGRRFRIYFAFVRVKDDQRIFAVVAFCNHHLHDASSGKQAPQGMGLWLVKSGAVARLDCVCTGMGVAAYECRSMGDLCP